MMKNTYKIMAAAALCIVSCGKEAPEEPYVPWRPEEVKEETTTLDQATRPMILTEQAAGKIVIVDQPTGKVAWEWKPSESSLSATQAAWFELPDEAKPVLDKSALLITASRGGVARVNVADSSVIFAAKPGGNPHSAEILPDGSIVVACSDGNKIVLYKKTGDEISTKISFSLPREAAHNVVWDKKRNCLWTASNGHVYKMSYNSAAPALVDEHIYDIPGDETMAHELIPSYGEDAMYLTTVQGVYKFYPETGTLANVDIFQQKNIKSISSGPEGWPEICTRPTSSSWWTSEVADFRGNRVYSFFKYQIYKARWYADQPFSY